MRAARRGPSAAAGSCRPRRARRGGRRSRAAATLAHHARRLLRRHRRRRGRGGDRLLRRLVGLIARERSHRLVVVVVRGHVAAARAAGVEAEHEVADVDLVPFTNDRRLRDLPAVHVRAVRALEVGHDEPTIAVEESRVMLRDVPLREHQVVPLNAPDVDLVLVEPLSSLSASLLADDDRKHFRSTLENGRSSRAARAHHARSASARASVQLRIVERWRATCQSRRDCQTGAAMRVECRAEECAAPRPSAGRASRSARERHAALRGERAAQESSGVARRPFTSEATIPSSSLASVITSRSA